MQFLYFIPNAGAASAEVLRDTGLAKILRCGVRAGPVGNGPGGSGGVLLAADQGPRARLRFAPDEQEWFRAGNAEIAEATAEPTPPDAAGGRSEYWIGYYVGDRPTPEELARTERVSGRDVRLADGNEWHLPCVRLFPEGTNLPLAYGLDPQTGAATQRVRADYQELWDATGELFAAYVGAAVGEEEEPGSGADREKNPDVSALRDSTSGFQEGGSGVTEGRAIEVVAAALGVNYRVGVRELLAIGALESECLRACVRAIADVDRFVALCQAAAGDGKKNGPENGKPTGSGGPA